MVVKKKTTKPTTRPIQVVNQMPATRPVQVLQQPLQPQYIQQQPSVVVVGGPGYGYPGYGFGAFGTGVLAGAIVADGFGPDVYIDNDYYGGKSKPKAVVKEKPTKPTKPTKSTKPKPKKPTKK